jgi:integrase
VTLIPKDAVGTIENRERDLSNQEARETLEAVDASSMGRPIKIAVRLLLLTMVRKGELLRAQWSHLDFDQAEWHVPREHSKTGRPHVVPLSPQAVALFRELQELACGSHYVLPSRFHIRKPMCLDTPNKVFGRAHIQHAALHGARSA